MRLYVLPVGTVEVDVQKYMSWEPDRGDRYAGPAAAFLIVLDDGEPVLVDTGLSPDHLADPEARVPQPDMVVTMRPEDDVRERLREIGVEPGQVRHVIQTHFDFDHCGGNRFFPQATFHVQRAHYEHAKQHPERFPPQDWDVPGLRYELLDGDRELFPGVEVVTTPGHAVGHQSVVLRGLARTGTVVLSIDAAHTHREFEEELLPATPEAADLRASIRKLKRIRDAERATLITCHDVDAWNDVYRISPRFYD